MVTQDGSITNELYIKPTHSGILLHYDSAHPKSLKVAIAQSQLQIALWVSNTPSGSIKSGTKMKVCWRMATQSTPSLGNRKEQLPIKKNGRWTTMVDS